MKCCEKWIALIAVASLLPAQVRVAASDAVVTVTPEETDEILANPGMGWETFHRPARPTKTCLRGFLQPSITPAGAGGN